MSFPKLGNFKKSVEKEIINPDIENIRVPRINNSLTLSLI
jgi:hypothetical protein